MDCSLVGNGFAGSIPGKNRCVNVAFSSIGRCPVAFAWGIAARVEIDNICIEVESFVLNLVFWLVMLFWEPLG